MASPTPTTDASGNIVTPPSDTNGPTGARNTQTAQDTQTGGRRAQTSAVSSFESGAMATTIPMLGAGAGVVLAALAAI